MKTLKSYIAAALLATLSLSACQDDVDAPGLRDPQAGIEPNMTIADLKAEYWSSADNCIDTIRLAEDGSHKIIAGRVISSDAAGNIYKSLVIQDATGALALSINQSSLYNKYQVGQEVVLDLTDMYIGKYSGLQQLGFPDYSETYGWQATFMPYAFFEEHARLNGLPQPELIDTILVRSFSDLSTSPEGLRKWQSQLVRFNNCHFELGGQATFTDAHKENASRTLILEDGNTLVVRNSGYATFWGNTLPAGNGDVVGILSYFNNAWQLLLRSANDCMNFGHPTMNPGTVDNPFTVADVIDIERHGLAATGWVTGYIVGAVAPEVTEITGDADIEWTKDATLDNTLVIAPSADVRSIDRCLVLPLPQGSALRRYGALTANPGNYGKQIWIEANSMEKQLGSWGVATLSGAAAQFRIDGVEVGGDDPGTDPSVSAPDFNTFNDGVATGYYVSSTSKNGWVMNNAQLLQGGSTDSSPVFTVFGDASVFAVCLNGNTSKVGTLTSPVIGGGIKTLSFKYCQPFSDTKCKVTINIKQNGSVVATTTLQNDGMTKLAPYEFTHDFNVSGNFTLEIVNDCPSAMASNKDRIAIWNLTWTAM